MTEHYNALVVFLQEDIREDDCQPLINAIKQMRGVINVEPQKADSQSRLYAERVRLNLKQRLMDALSEDFHVVHIPKVKVTR